MRNIRLPELGFHVSSFRFPPLAASQLMGSYCPKAAFLDTHPHHCNNLPSIIFLDAISLPCGVNLDVYWGYWRTPHAFFYKDGDSYVPTCTTHPRPCAPKGWVEQEILLSQYDAGGGTSSRWGIVVWYLPGIHPSFPTPLGSQSWFPMHACINDRTHA